MLFIIQNKVQLIMKLNTTYLVRNASVGDMFAARSAG